MGSAEDFAERGDPRILVRRPAGDVDRTRRHGPELPDLERLPAQADARLAEEHRPPIAEGVADRDERHERNQDGTAGDGQDDVDRTLQRRVRAVQRLDVSHHGEPIQ